MNTVSFVRSTHWHSAHSDIKTKSLKYNYYKSNQRHSSVVIATGYGVDGPGIESHWGGGGTRFSALVQIGPEARSASYTMGTGSFQGVKRPGRDVDHPPPSSAEVKESVELYLYSISGPSWPVIAWAYLYLYQRMYTVLLKSLYYDTPAPKCFGPHWSIIREHTFVQNSCLTLSACRCRKVLTAAICWRHYASILYNFALLDGRPVRPKKIVGAGAL